MNLRDLFAAAIAVADADQREALLQRESAGQPDLRSRLGQCRVRFLECAALIAVGLLAFELATLYPSPPRPTSGGVRESSSWREKDWFLWYNAQQLYRRDPDELRNSELEAVRQWCRCLAIFGRHEKTGLNSLTRDECELVVETLQKLRPNLQEHDGFRPFYEACRRRLADAPSGAWRATNTREKQS
jgi:hypothetical protein